MGDVHFNPMDPEFIEDPYPTYHRLRAEDLGRSQSPRLLPVRPSRTPRSRALRVYTSSSTRAYTPSTARLSPWSHAIRSSQPIRHHGVAADDGYRDHPPLGRGRSRSTPSP